MTYQPTHAELYDSLSPTFLEEDPVGFLENLELCVDSDFDIKDYINDNEIYETWYSPLPICLFYLVGTLKEPYKNETPYFYGCKTVITDDMGIKIMKYLWWAGADISIKNYYDENLLECIQHCENNKYALTTRANNKKFIQFIKSILY